MADELITRHLISAISDPNPDSRQESLIAACKQLTDLIPYPIEFEKLVATKDLFTLMILCKPLFSVCVIILT